MKKRWQVKSRGTAVGRCVAVELVEDTASWRQACCDHQARRVARTDSSGAPPDICSSALLRCIDLHTFGPVLIFISDVLLILVMWPFRSIIDLYSVHRDSFLKPVKTHFMASKRCPFTNAFDCFFKRSNVRIFTKLLTWNFNAETILRIIRSTSLNAYISWMSAFIKIIRIFVCLIWCPPAVMHNYFMASDFYMYRSRFSIQSLTYRCNI